MASMAWRKMKAAGETIIGAKAGEKQYNMAAMANHRRNGNGENERGVAGANSVSGIILAAGAFGINNNGGGVAKAYQPNA